MGKKLIGILLIGVHSLFGCTDFVIQSVDGAYINGRSLEFAMDLEAKIQVFPRKAERVSQGPNGEAGIQWISQYGYLGVTVFDLSFSMDGMNEKGLSLGFLWLPGTEYQSISGKDGKKPLDFVDFADWILGNFATVAEVKKALKTVRVWGHPVPPLPGIPPIHMAIHDAEGNHLVVEFINGEMHVYDNSMTVLTNYPTFDWMQTNLQNYIHLDAFNAPAVRWKKMVFAGTGQGSGLLGLPGDSTPPSRFVKISTYLRFVEPIQTAADGVNLAEHLLNSVDIPLGIVREKIKNKVSEDYTQWVVIKDLTSKIFYFRSYKDLCLKAIDLKKVNFQMGAKNRPIPIDMKKGYVDVTQSFHGY